MHSFHAHRPVYGSQRLHRPWLAIASEAERIANGDGEQYHALVSHADRVHPIKFHPMTDAEARERNASIRALGYEWRRQEPMR